MKIGTCIDHGYKGDGLGYARIIHYVDGVRVREGRHVKALRDAIGLSRADVFGKVVRHKCDNPRCINPDHLELGTYKDNTHDMLKRGRHTNSIPLGEFSGRCKLTDSQVKEIQNRYVKGSRVSGSTALAREFNITPTQVLYIVKGLSRVQGSGLRENTSWV